MFSVLSLRGKQSKAQKKGHEKTAGVKAV